MTLEEIQAVIVDLLAVEADQDRDELWAELIASGAEMPCDSVLAAEVLGEVERRCGVRLRMTPATAAAMRSVTAYAEAVQAAIGADEIAIAAGPHNGVGGAS